MDTQTLNDVSTAAAQMSMWDLVWASDMVTKVVMIGLIAASVWSWAIIFEKFGTLRWRRCLLPQCENGNAPTF